MLHVAPAAMGEGFVKGLNALGKAKGRWRGYSRAPVCSTCTGSDPGPELGAHKQLLVVTGEEHPGGTSSPSAQPWLWQRRRSRRGDTSAA